MEPPELLGYVVAVVAIIGTALYLRSRAGAQDVPLNAKVPPAFYAACRVNSSLDAQLFFQRSDAATRNITASSLRGDELK